MDYFKSNSCEIISIDATINDGENRSDDDGHTRNGSRFSEAHKIDGINLTDLDDDLTTNAVEKECLTRNGALSTTECPGRVKIYDDSPDKPLEDLDKDARKLHNGNFMARLCTGELIYSPARARRL